MNKDGCICYENMFGFIGDCPVHDVPRPVPPKHDLRHEIHDRLRDEIANSGDC